MKVKVCGLKYQENREAVAALQPDYIGLIFFDRSPRNIEETRPGNDGESQTVKKVGVFVDADLSEMQSRIQTFQLDAVQLHGFESPETIRALKEAHPFLEVFKAFRVGPDFDFQTTLPYASLADFFLFDTKGPKAGGNGRSFDWSILERYQGATPFFLSGGIGPADADRILQFRHPRLEGVDVNSGFEIEPGRKDEQQLKIFLEKLKPSS
jgi:phosphoribosylanthranilate isomerase